MIVVSRRRRVDWSRVIENLERSGITVQKIADHLDVHPNTVKQYRGEMTAEPAFWTGTKLLMLWAQTLGVPWTDAPMRNVQPSVSEMLRSMS